MLAYDYGICVNNFVGHYKMVDKNGESYIISDEQYSPKDGEEAIKLKQIRIDEYGQKDFLIIALANVNIEKDESIIGFCNKYGLPYSSLNNLRNQYIDFKEQDFDRHDNMSRFEFCRHVLSARHFLNVKNELNNKDYNPNIMLKNLLSLLLFERLGLYMPEIDEKGNFKFDIEPTTSTGVYSSNFHILFHLTVGYIDNEKKLYEVIQTFNRKSCDYNKLYLVKNEDDRKEIIYWIMLGRLLSLVRDAVKERDVVVNKYYDIVFRENIEITDEIKGIMDIVAPIIFSDLVNEGLSNIQPILNVDENGKFFSRLSLPCLFDGIYTELLMMCSAGDQMCKCKNTSCGKFFISETRYNKMYCCRECAVAAAKRRQRIRDKEDPNRERQLPGFKGRKKKK